MKNNNQKVADFLGTLKLSGFAERVIDSTDISMMDECFGGLKTVEEVEKFILENYFDQYELDDIAGEMNDEIREDLNYKMAGCKPIDFLKAYVERDPEFTDWLHRNKGIELD